MIIAGTGHRPDKLGGYSDKVSHRLVQLAVACIRKYKPTVVISGMALGWDQALAEAAIAELVPLWAYVPFDGQDKKWPEASQARYRELLDLAEEAKVIDSGGYSAAAMQKRNQAMVDDCDMLLALWNGSPGGTANCIKYAESIKQVTTNVWDSWVKHKGF